jgi:streptomycin 6-kinase
MVFKGESMKRKYGDRAGWSRIIGKDYRVYERNTSVFTGVVCELFIREVQEPLWMLQGNRKICVADKGYTWLQYFPKGKPYTITTMLDANRKVVQWYIDICESHGIRADGVPWYDDLYLDVVCFPDGEAVLLDEDELCDALDANLITKKQYDCAEKTAQTVLRMYQNGELQALLDFTSVPSSVPYAFCKKITACFGEKGTQWLMHLDDTVHTYEENWSLYIGEPISNLSYNYVLRAQIHGGTPVILKLGIPGHEFNNEVQTLQIYDGKGCARLLQVDAAGGAMLLECLEPGVMLREEKDERTALLHYAEVWKALRRPLPSHMLVPKVADWMKGLDRFLQNQTGDATILVELVYKAKMFFGEIISSEPEELLHGDLHHQNILYTNEGWKAIDPKGLAGSRYFDVTSFLVNELKDVSNAKAVLNDRVSMLSEELQLNRERILKAGFAMAILYTCWSVEEDSVGWKDTYEYAQWFLTFLEE